MRTSPRRVSVFCALALVATACSSGGAAPETTPSVSSASETTEASPSPSEDPFAVPDPVTKEYVDRVINTIYEEWGAIARDLLEQPADPTAITPIETRKTIETLFGGQYLLQRFDEADALLRGDRDGLVPLEDFGQLRVTTRQVKRATEGCLVVAADLSTHETASDGETILAAFSLTPEPGANATGWKIIDVVRSLDSDGNRVPDEVMLDASVEDLSDVLNNSCAEEGTA